MTRAIKAQLAIAARSTVVHLAVTVVVAPVALFGGWHADRRCAVEHCVLGFWTLGIRRTGCARPVDVGGRIRCERRVRTGIEG